MAREHDDLIGKTLGQYTLIEEIGRGGMATVYSAKQLSMNRIVAVKILPRHFMHDPGFLERFEREVEVISQLEHPHILPIYDYGEADGVPYIAMRYLGGGSMAQMVRRGVPNIQDIEKPFTQIAQALDYAHQQGVIHRDLKPGNIMLDDSGNAYLSDFGIARVMGSDLTGSAIIGTPAYMSPEQAHGLPIDARSDIYALGIVLFELITGREPFQSETPMGLLLMHINEAMPPINELRDDVPDGVEGVIQKATAKTPDERYSSAGNMARAFANALRGTPDDSQPSTARIDPHRTVTGDIKPMKGGGGTVIAGAKPGTRSSASATTRVESPTVPDTPSDPVMPAPRQSRGMGLLIGLVLLLVVGGVAGVAILPGLTAGAPLVMPTPTLFPSSIRISQPDYSIAIPRELVPARDDFIDESDENRLYHRWRGREGALDITLALVSADRVSITQYNDLYYDGGRQELTLIDEYQAPNGSMRRSYAYDRPGQKGQLDVFYQVRDGYLVVIEMFTDEAVGGNADVITTLQRVLDSLQITPPATT